MEPNAGLPEKLEETDELVNLFASLDAITASDELKSSTLAAIFAQGDADGGSDTDGASDTDDASDANDASDADGVSDADNASEDGVDEEKLCEGAAKADSVPLAGDRGESQEAYQADASADAPRKGNGKGSRARIRKIQVFALAACLASVLVGGVAYATPTAHVQVSEGESSIDLGVNCFGIAVTAVSDDEAVKNRIDEAGIVHKASGDAVDMALGIVQEFAPDTAPEITVDTGDTAQRTRLEQEAESAIEKRQPPSGQAPAQIAEPSAAQQPGSDSPQASPAPMGDSQQASMPAQQPEDGAMPQRGTDGGQQSDGDSAHAPAPEENASAQPVGAGDQPEQDAPEQPTGGFEGSAPDGAGPGGEPGGGSGSPAGGPGR